jgi:hypothetical protein
MIDRVINSIPWVSATVPMHQQLVVSRMSMANCRYHRGFERFRFKRPSRRGASDTATAAARSVECNRPGLRRRAAGIKFKEPANAWKLERYLTERRKETDSKHEFRSSRLKRIFARLLCERRSQ